MPQQSVGGAIHFGDLTYRTTVVPTGATNGSEVTTSNGDASYVEVGPGGAVEYPIAPGALTLADFVQFTVTVVAASIDITTKRLDTNGVLIGMGNREHTNVSGTYFYAYRDYWQEGLAFSTGTVGQYATYTMVMDLTGDQAHAQKLLDHYLAGNLLVFVSSNGSSTTGTQFRVTQLLIGTVDVEPEPELPTQSVTAVSRIAFMKGRS